ncbi:MULTISPECIES: AAA family ATPase [unclassified Nocardiopsis]|uniref:AAA family ATPase n=1 Tax=unclassified Nocardiopsis TaxID=2649073 RepID=UPI001359FF5E|nr:MULTISPECIES: AAA family ATPase [unclassified Nocardiopsis]
MRIKTVRVENFRRLRQVKIDLNESATVCVGANNSGKTSITHIFRSFFVEKARDLTFYDFNSGCWDDFAHIDEGADFPVIRLDLLLEVEKEDWYRVIEMMSFQDLDEDIGQVALRVEFGPKDGPGGLLADFREARRKARHTTRKAKSEKRWRKGVYSPWPEDMRDYLDKTLRDSYALSYHVIDPRSFDRDECRPEDVVGPLTDNPTAAQRFLNSLVRVDMVDAQRFLSDDPTSKGLDLSRHVSKFLRRNIDSSEVNHAALQAMRISEQGAEGYLQEKLKDTFDELHDSSDDRMDNLRLVVRSRVDNDGLIMDSASIHVSSTSIDGRQLELPERYNGLGYKNYLYMILEIIGMHRAWTRAEEDRSLIHLVVIEEPEAHMHPQLQQAFLNVVKACVQKNATTGFHTQIIVTTHSPNIIYDTSFDPIRYFRRITETAGAPATQVRDLSRLNVENDETNFLRRFLKLTNCHLFFADAVVLVEGDAERILLPLMIENHAPNLSRLTRAHISYLEVGGSHAFRFKNLVEFLGLPALIITDLDSVDPAQNRRACTAATDGAVTSNKTLIDWLPRKESVQELRTATVDEKIGVYGVGESSSAVRVAYQTPQAFMWQGVPGTASGRTLEDAMLLENLAWVEKNGKDEIPLKLDSDMSHGEVVDKVHTFVRELPGGKANLALTFFDLFTKEKWTTPHYIDEGLAWLNARLDRGADL